MYCQHSHAQCDSVVSLPNALLLCSCKSRNRSSVHSTITMCTVLPTKYWCTACSAASSMHVSDAVVDLLTLLIGVYLSV
jgi:hypothetical protein